MRNFRKHLGKQIKFWFQIGLATSFLTLTLAMFAGGLWLMIYGLISYALPILSFILGLGLFIAGTFLIYQMLINLIPELKNQFNERN